MKSTKRYTTFDEIARDINILFDAVNKPEQSVGREAEGKSGDLRFVTDDGGLGYLEARGDNGWYTTFIGGMTQRLQRGRPYPHFEFLEVDNLFAHQFTVRQLNAVNGDTLFSDTGTVESVTSTTVRFKIQDGLNLCSFAVNDLIVSRRIKADKSLDVSYVKATVTAVSGNVVTVTYTSTDKFQVGDVVVRVGNTTDASRKDSVYIATNPANTPYIDIYDNINSFDTSGSPTTAWTTATPKVRIGNLNGISGSYDHGIYIGSGGELRIDGGASVSGIVTTYSQEATPSTPNTGDIWNRTITDGVSAVVVNNDGSGYTVGDVLTLAGGTGGKVYVTKVDGTGQITGYSLYAYGYGYTTSTQAASGGTGTLATFNITAGQSYNLLYRYDGSWSIVGSTGTQITGDGIYTGLIIAQQIIAGTLTGFTINTATTGKRIEMSTSGILTFYDTTGAVSSSINGGSTNHLEIISGGKLFIGSGTGATDNLYLDTGGTLVVDATTGINMGGNASDVSINNNKASFGLIGATGNISLTGDGSITLTTDNASISGGTLTLGIASTTEGALVLKNITNAFTTAFRAPNTATTNRTVDLPNADGTVALEGWVTGTALSGYATESWVNTNYDTFPGFGSTGTTACVGNDARLSDARTPASHDNTYHSTAYATGGWGTGTPAGPYYVATSSGGSPTTAVYGQNLDINGSFKTVLYI